MTQQDDPGPFAPPSTLSTGPSAPDPYLSPTPPALAPFPAGSQPPPPVAASYPPHLPPSYPPPWTPAVPAPAPRGSTHVIAVMALIVAIVALLVGVVPVLGMIFGSVSGSYELTGTAPMVVRGQPYPGPQLADELTRVIEADGGDVGEISCPDTPRVDDGATTVCTGTVDDWDEKLTVDFQDGEGHFVLTEEDADPTDAALT